jgi:hypothetical protein
MCKKIKMIMALDVSAFQLQGKRLKLRCCPRFSMVQHHDNRKSD